MQQLEPKGRNVIIPKAVLAKKPTGTHTHKHTYTHARVHTHTYTHTDRHTHGKGTLSKALISTSSHANNNTYTV